MRECTDKKGRRYIVVTPEEQKALPEFTPVYRVEGGKAKAIAPPDCKHDFEITPGAPRNIKACKNCIYWEFTQEEPTKEIKNNEKTEIY